MATKMVITQPLPVMDLTDSDMWGSGIFDCFQNVPECCFGYWCLPCFACKITKDYGQCLCLPLVDFLCFSITPPVAMSMRVSMRQRYGIKGTMAEDCVLSSFCRACVWCQMSREMKRRNIQIVLVNARTT